MPTAQDYVIRARQKLRIHADEEPLAAYELDKGIAALASMLMRWVATGAIKAFRGCNTATDVVVIVLLDDTEWTFEADSAIIANLTVDMADDYGKQVSALVLSAAATGVNTLAMAGMAGLDTLSTFDPALSFMPSQKLITGPVDGA